jgi:hypothetical protein
LTKARRLPDNVDISFMGDTPAGPFDIDEETASNMLYAKGNPHRRMNSDVIRQWVNAKDITSRSRQMWSIDFGVKTTEEEAALYEMPFQYITQHVKPFRAKAKSSCRGIPWFLHLWPRPEMREAIWNKKRYIATPRVSKHRVFVWLENTILPSDATIVFARDDDYFFGVLHSRVHELWSRRKGTQLREAKSGFRYTPNTTFETFPFPWPPGKEPKNDPRVEAIAQAARELVEKRNAWLNPEGATEKELKKRTLTNLYNERPTWLNMAHRKLDDAVFDAYGWSHDSSDEEILSRLLALNSERAKVNQ